MKSLSNPNVFNTNDIGLALLIQKSHIRSISLKRWIETYKNLKFSKTSRGKLYIMGYRNDIHDFYINHIKKFRKWYFESNDSQLLVGASITPFNV